MTCGGILVWYLRTYFQVSARLLFEQKAENAIRQRLSDETLSGDPKQAIRCLPPLHLSWAWKVSPISGSEIQRIEWVLCFGINTPAKTK